MSAEVRSSRSQLIWNILKIALALVLAAYVLSRTELDQLFALRERIQFGWLAAVFILYILLTVLKALQYYFLIGRQVAYAQVLNIVVIQNTTSNFIATSAGIASYLTLFRVEQGVKLSRAAVAFLITKVGDLISIWLFLAAAGLGVWPQVEALHAVTVAALAGIGAALAVFFAVVLLRERSVSLLQTLVDRLGLGRLGIVKRLMQILHSLAAQEQGFVFRMLGMGILFSLLYMLVTLAWLYAGLQTFSFDVALAPVVFVNVLMQLFSYLPIQVLGGLGVSETSLLYLYGLFGLPQTELAAVLIGTRVLFYAANLVVLLYLPLHSLLLNRSSRLPK
ncbi:MAG TPA: lysylphosphatidylglycerol synthase domain-containing protein [Anaerolineales bacterium]|jgi:uncharacterized membrane protein YbhN (UPF0104 family)